MPKTAPEDDRKPAVLDTNGYISGILFPGSVPARALSRIRHDHRMLVSRETREELFRTFLKSKFDRYLALEDRLAALRELHSEMKIVEVKRDIVACRDPKDDKFLSLAVAGKATLLITGDKDLLALHPFGSVQIFTPSGFPGM